ncbi:MAG: Extracellular ligand-binding receptor [Solirubrobacterales bacterium]|nr:Extracellular ligand-binding receptor [Solirubrobacterales bacterium]
MGFVPVFRTVVAAATIGLAGSSAGGAGAAVRFTPLPESFCSPVFSGGVQPQVLIVSDLPIRWFPFHKSTVEMQAAIRFVLAQQGYKAGRFRVGYQSCDDSSPQASQGDLTKCAANAKAFAGNASAIGVIGTWSSQCAAVEIPILDTAPHGPLILVSPTNTNVGLTHATAGTSPGEPARYYPNGRRNFVRLASADDDQGRADALLADRLGAHRVFVLNDDTSYGLSVAEAFTSAAHSLSVAIAGTASWHPGQARFSALVKRVRATQAGGVFLAGSDSPNVANLIRALRAALGHKGVLIAPDGFSPAGLDKQVRAAGEGMYISVPGATLAGLNPLGQEIARRFGPYRLGSGGPVYAAEAAEVLLTAIAHSDGTRDSVTRAVFATRIKNGILGTFAFDRNGDSTYNPVLIYQVLRGRARLNRVVTAPPP